MYNNPNTDQTGTN